ncbi:unnamed protein product [Rotaria sordida]|uniref:G-protein coupled receptors family 1 profile domain-containing protein n=1 Tax=Rotaria sordida TaxID=392033 RepID=A0A814C2Q0_9BILA|nr:unnamed protein product [Rotaria sordida]
MKPLFKNHQLFKYFFLILTCAIPPILMTIFGILTVFNVKKLRTQVGPQNNYARNERLRSKDRQLIIMLLIQVLMTILCTLPFSVANITSMIFQYLITLSDYGDAINTFYSNLSRLINYFNPVVGLYIYINYQVWKILYHWTDEDKFVELHMKKQYQEW